MAQYTHVILAYTVYAFKRCFRTIARSGCFCPWRCAIKLIETVINRFKLEEVRIALDEIGVKDFREIDVATPCHQKHQVKIFRSARFVANLYERVKLQIIAADDSVGKVVEAIGSIARTERKENCRIAIKPY